MIRNLVCTSLIAGAVMAGAIAGHAQAPSPSQAAPTPRAASARAMAAARTYMPPRTPWGHPDLQGTYTTTNENGVPLERPDQFPATEGLSDQEFQKIVKER